MSKEEAFKELVKEIADYFNKVINDVDEKKITFFINRYLNQIPQKTRIVTQVEKIYIPQYIPVVKQEDITSKLSASVEDTDRYLSDLAIVVCDTHGIELDELIRGKIRVGKRKIKSEKYVDARQDFANIASTAGISKVEIGKFLGYKDHSSIVHLTVYRSNQQRFA
jgi:hypothetical protein